MAREMNTTFNSIKEKWLRKKHSPARTVSYLKVLPQEPRRVRGEYGFVNY